MVRSPHRPQDIRQARQTKWAELMGWVDAHEDSRWVYRGLGDATFRLIPGVGRSRSYDELRERTILEIFQRRASEFINASDVTKRWDALALAQHHGLPTRLLDWTTNPLVAAYFAVTSPPSRATARIIAWSVSSREILDPETMDDPFQLDTVRYLLPRALTTRVVSQSGLFSVHPDPKTPWQEPLRDPNHRFDIPPNMRGYFQRKLFYLGIDPQRIMGGLDGLCRRLAWQYDVRVGIGAVKL